MGRPAVVSPGQPVPAKDGSTAVPPPARPGGRSQADISTDGRLGLGTYLRPRSAPLLVPHCRGQDAH